MRYCDYCKKPMYTSWYGYLKGVKWVEVHKKCLSTYKNQIKKEENNEIK